MSLAGTGQESRKKPGRQGAELVQKVQRHGRAFIGEPPELQFHGFQAGRQIRQGCAIQGRLVALEEGSANAFQMLAHAWALDAEAAALTRHFFSPDLQPFLEQGRHK